MIQVTVLNRIAMTTTDIKLQICLGMVPGAATYTIRGFWKSLRNSYGALTYLPTKLLVSLLDQHSIAGHSVLVIFQIAEIETPYSRNTYPVYPSVRYGALPDTFPKIPKILATDTIRSTHKLFLIF